MTVQPMQAIPIGGTAVSFNAYDPNYVSPYVQNYTLSVTRNVAYNLTLDVRYVGNIAVKQNKSINLNASNFLYNGLKEQFDSIRAGGEAPLLDQMLGGINITGAGLAIGTVSRCAAAASQMRASATFNTNLANGNYSAVAGSLATLAYTTANNPTLPVIPNGQTVGSALRNSGQFPANFIQANPQFTNATYNTNLGHTNYQSMEVQTTYRPIQGVSWQGTYTLSKNLGTPTTFTNPVDRSVDGYQLIGNNPFHQFRSNGSIELPIGPNKLVFGNSSGIFARASRALGGQLHLQRSNGSTNNNYRFNNSVCEWPPGCGSPFPYDLKGIIWEDGAPSGSYFPAGTFGTAPDPQCAVRWGTVTDRCTFDVPQSVHAPGAYKCKYRKHHPAKCAPGKPGHTGSRHAGNCGYVDTGCQHRKKFPNQRIQECAAASRRYKYPEPPITHQYGVRCACQSSRAGFEPCCRRSRPVWYLQH